MGKNILIVEDDEEIASIVRNHLTKAGYEMNWASTGQEGLEDFQKGNYDLLIVDIMMPEMDGFQFCKNVRLTSDMPILIISACISDEDKVKGLQLGADDYMTKPFSLVELQARVESHLRRYHKSFSNDPEDYNIKQEYTGGLEIYKASNEVIVKGVKIHLTSKEFALLALLVQNPNKAYTKKELYEYVWSEIDVNGNGSNTVTVHIKELREKLGENIKNPSFIQTVWGVGYKFIGERIS